MSEAENTGAADASTSTTDAAALAASTPSIVPVDTTATTTSGTTVGAAVAAGEAISPTAVLISAEDHAEAAGIFARLESAVEADAKAAWGKIKKLLGMDNASSV